MKYNPLRFIAKLVKSNTGYSSKTALMLWGAVIITLWSLFFMYMIYLQITLLKQMPNYLEIVALLGGLGTLAGIVIYGKLKGEANEITREQLKNNSSNTTQL